MSAALGRAGRFCERFGLTLPILLAPMAGVPAPALSVAVGEAGGLGGCGVLLMEPDAIASWVAEVRSRTSAGFQLNLWIPDPPPIRDAAHETAVRDFLANWGPPVPPEAADAAPPDFSRQFDAVVAARPRVASSVMGLFPAPVALRLRREGIAWFATVSTVAEALQAEAAGADALIAQGMEAGGHRGSFDAGTAESEMVGLVALIPALVDAVTIPVVATGGIGDSRALAAALLLGASAVQIGSGFLRCPEAAIHPTWAAALGTTRPEGTRVTRAFSGRPGRAIATSYVRAAGSASAPAPAPYPVQRGLSAAMRASAMKAGELQRMQAWAGQASAFARAEPAAVVVNSLWDGALDLLGAGAKPNAG